MYSSSGSDVCSVCEAGHYCGSNETSAVDMITGGGWGSRSDSAGVCFNGTYCAPGMTRAPGDENKFGSQDTAWGVFTLVPLATRNRNHREGPKTTDR